MSYENFTTYTENDPAGDVTITSNKIDVVTYDSYSVTNVYKDFGANHFNELDIDFEIFINSSSGSNNPQAGVALVNTSTPNSEVRGTLATTDVFAFIYKYSTSYRIYFFRGSGVASGVYTVSANTVYYCTISRSANSDSISLKIYSNSARTTLLNTITLTGFGTTTKWQYFYGLLVHQGSEANDIFTGYIQNVDLNEATPPVTVYGNSLLALV